MLRAEIAASGQLAEREREFTRQEEDLAAVLDENSRLRQERPANADASREDRNDPLPGIRSKPLRSLLLSVQSLLTDLQAADADFLALEGERTEARRAIFSLEQRLAAMRPAEEAAPAIAYPEVLDADSVRTWIRNHHADRLVLHPRAARALDKHD